MVRSTHRPAARVRAHRELASATQTSLRNGRFKTHARLFVRRRKEERARLTDCFPPSFVITPLIFSAPADLADSRAFPAAASSTYSQPDTPSPLSPHHKYVRCALASFATRAVTCRVEVEFHWRHRRRRCRTSHAAEDAQINLTALSATEVSGS